MLGRRLPTYDELQAALSYQEIALANGGEFTGSVMAQGAQLQVTVITGEGGSVTQVPNDGNVPKAYRCAADPLN